MKINGHGGWLAVGTEIVSPTATLIIPTIQHNAEWELVLSCETRETRSVGCGGWEESLLKWKRVEMATFKVADDDALFIEALGFVEGQELRKLWFKRGSTGIFDAIEYPLVRTVRLLNNQKKARWLEVVLHRGMFSRNVTAPVIP